jgi:phosphoribosylformimino-5-aminoimidazole carboxamide ribotide isomerase
MIERRNNMIILPAIDLKDGKVVRLYRGDFQTVHQVAEDPVATATAFYQAGARWIHMVDLDGAKDGSRKNEAIVKAVAQVGLQIELGGGIRSMEDLEAVFALGVTRAVIGSAAVSHPEFVRAAVQRYGDRVAVGIDTKDGKVKTAGWIENSGLDYLEFARAMDDISVKTIIFTDIDTDGMLSGPSFDRLRALQQAVSCRIVASGGVSNNQDIRDLAAMGLYGAIIGKAYYAGTIDVAQAVADGGPQK